MNSAYRLAASAGPMRRSRPMRRVPKPRAAQTEQHRCRRDKADDADEQQLGRQASGEPAGAGGVEWVPVVRRAVPEASSKGFAQQDQRRRQQPGRSDGGQRLRSDLRVARRLRQLPYAPRHTGADAQQSRTDGELLGLRNLAFRDLT